MGESTRHPCLPDKRAERRALPFMLYHTRFWKEQFNKTRSPSFLRVGPRRAGLRQRPGGASFLKAPRTRGADATPLARLPGAATASRLHSRPSACRRAARSERQKRSERIVKFHEMTFPELRQVPRAGALVLAPIAAVEQHSRHLAVLTDTVLVTGVAEGVEQRLPESVVLLPTLWFGRQPSPPALWRHAVGVGGRAYRHAMRSADAASGGRLAARADPQRPRRQHRHDADGPAAAAAALPRPHPVGGVVLGPGGAGAGGAWPRGRARRWATPASSRPR